VQNIGASAEHLRELVTGLGELVRGLVPGAGGIDGELETALAAAADGAVDRSVLRRFADWVVSTVQAGATAAVVPAVSSAATAMMLEAGRLCRPRNRHHRELTKARACASAVAANCRKLSDAPGKVTSVGLDLVAGVRQAEVYLRSRTSRSHRTSYLLA
jgi:hypothetical protein